MKSKLGIGGKLLIAFGSVALLSVLSAVVGWLAFDRITEVQNTVVADTVPSLNKVKSLAQVSAMMAAVTPKLVDAQTETRRKLEAKDLFDQANSLDQILQGLKNTKTNPETIERLVAATTQILLNLRGLNELVNTRIALDEDFSLQSKTLLTAVAEIVEISEALVSNAAAGTSATVASLYPMIDLGSAPEQVLTVLDNLIEVDLDHMEQMFEARHRVTVSGLIIEQLEQTDTAEGVFALHQRFTKNAKILQRRINSIRDPHRRQQALNFLEVLVQEVSDDAAQTVFTLRKLSLNSDLEISELVNTNRRLTDDVAHMAEDLVSRAEMRMQQAVFKADLVVQRSNYLLLIIAVGTVGLAIPIMWVFVRNGVVWRVRRLAATTHDLAIGNLSVEINHSGSDELSDMADALQVFKVSALEKQENDAELRRHKDELEQIVEHRTEQVTRANMRLSEEVEKHAIARQAAEEANRAKSTFLATMSHEIRTPISSVLGTLHLLDDETLESGVRQRLDVIRASSETLLSIINDVLDYSKIEAGHLGITSTEFDLSALMDDLRLMMSTVAEVKNVALIVVADIIRPAVYIGDAGHIRQVLINIVGNALKFTDEGQVVVHVSENEQGVLFEIEDTGIGISQATQAKLFEPFYQNDDPDGTRAGGSGLGLSISHRLVEAMNGTITVNSDVGVGTLFQVNLPLQKSINAGAIFNSVSPDLNIDNDAQWTVLLVEDNEVNREITRSFLEHAGHRVIDVANGRQAVDIATSQNINVVLMDINLPDFNGLEATRRIRCCEHPMRSQVPIIAISAHVFQEEVDSYLVGGMNGFIGKPFSPAQLEETLKAALYGEGVKLAEVAAVSSDLIFDPAVLNGDISILGVEKIKHLIAVFLDKLESDIGNLLRAGVNGDTEKVADLSHALKSAAGSLGATALFQSARNLEIAAKSGPMDSRPELMDGLVPLVAQTRLAMAEYSLSLQETSAANK